MPELQALVPNVVLQPGSSGRLEVFAPRMFGLCAVPIGSLMQTPGVGQVLASHLAPSGAVVTQRGGLSSGVFQCDGFLEWTIPITQQQPGVASLHAPPVALLLVLAAIGAVLVALGWAVARLRLLVQAVTESLGGPASFALIIAGVLAVIGLVLVKPRRRT